MRRRTRGWSHTPTYRSWIHMHERCRKHPRYAGRGIAICERWNDFANFLSDMGERPIGKSLDRFPDNDGNYEPANCRWATPKEQIAGRGQVRNGLCIRGHPLDVMRKSGWRTCRICRNGAALLRYHRLKGN